MLHGGSSRAVFWGLFTSRTFSGESDEEEEEEEEEEDKISGVVRFQYLNFRLIYSFLEPAYEIRSPSLEELRPGWKSIISV